jgi:hypothetical protein
MNDIELNKVIAAARYPQTTKESLIKYLKLASDRVDALTAENAEKDRRIAELEAGQKHGKWVDDGCCFCKCTACGNHVLGNTSESLRRYNLRPYCENCGAKMDGE